MQPPIPPPYPTPSVSPPPQGGLTKEEKNWAMLCHLSALLGFVLMPSANIWAPLVVWLWKRNDSTYVDEQGRESVNFHISIWLYTLLTGAMWFTIILIPLVLVMWAIFYVMGIAYTVVAAIAASNGRSYTYPWTIRFF